MTEIRETFPDSEVRTLPEREGEVQGLEAVRSIAAALSRERDSDRGEPSGGITE